MPKDVVMWSQSDVQTQFKAGRLAMMFMGCWAIGGLEKGQEDGSVAFEWDNFAIPKDATYGSVYGGENLAIVKGDGEEESVDFLKWFMEYDRNKKWNIDSGHFIPREKTLSDPDFTDRPHWKVVIDLIPYTNARPADPKWPEISLDVYKRQASIRRSRWSFSPVCSVCIFMSTCRCRGCAPTPEENGKTCLHY